MVVHTKDPLGNKMEATKTSLFFVLFVGGFFGFPSCHLRNREIYKRCYKNLKTLVPICLSGNPLPSTEPRKNASTQIGSNATLCATDSNARHPFRIRDVDCYDLVHHRSGTMAFVCFGFPIRTKSKFNRHHTFANPACDSLDYRHLRTHTIPHLVQQLQMLSMLLQASTVVQTVANPTPTCRIDTKTNTVFSVCEWCDQR
jgi:hypothetical protein